MFAVVNNTMIHIEIHMCTTFAFLEKEMTTHSSILAWRNPWTEEPGGLQSMGSQRVRHNLTAKQQLLRVK